MIGQFYLLYITVSHYDAAHEPAAVHLLHLQPRVRDSGGTEAARGRPHRGEGLPVQVRGAAKLS